MKFLVFGLSFAFAVCSGNIQYQKSDMNNEDLKKYSYLVSGDTILSIGKGHMQGTGFFIKREDKIYFVCAKHTLSGCNDKNVKDDRSPNIMYIHVGDMLIPIDVKPIKDSAPCLPMVLDPDIIAAPINTAEINQVDINVINEHEGNLPQKFSELIIWGFPNSESRITSFQSKDISILTNLYVEVDNKPYTDNIHYCTEIKDKNVKGTAGFSGSPAFLKDVDSGKFVFIGIFVGVHPDANGLYIVQPKYLYDQIN